MAEISPSAAGAMHALRALVVDDEAPAVNELLWLLGQQGIADVASASSAAEALRFLEAQPVDVVFLDIEMPDLSGIDLARVLGRMVHPPLVVFVTAFDRHAVDAFEVKAIDYVLKPIRTDRLDETLRRVRQTVGSRKRVAGEGSPTGPGAESSTRVAIESAGKTIYLERSDVVAVEAARDYVRLHTATKSYLVRIPISTLESEWSAFGFVRVHRSYLVSVSHVRELRSEGQGLLVSVGSLEIPVSRSYTRNLRERLASDRIGGA